MPPAPQKLLPFDFDDDELLLWHCPKPRESYPGRWALIGIFLLLSAGLAHSAFTAASHATAGLLGFSGLFLVLILVVLGNISFRNRVTRRTHYILTTKAAYISERPAKEGRRWFITCFAVHPQMAARVRHHGRGLVDYVFGAVKRGSNKDPQGFLNLPPEQNPAAAFEQLGVMLPAKGEKKRELFTFEPPASPVRTMWGNGFLFCLFGIGLYFMHDNHAADLYVWGHEATGTVEDYRQGEERRGRSRRRVEVHYPVVSFRTSDGSRRLALSQTGYDKAPELRIGDNVELLYDPTDPTRATIKDGTILILPGLFLLLLGINAWNFAKALREYRQLRRTCAFLLAVDTAAGSFDAIALDDES